MWAANAAPAAAAAAQPHPTAVQLLADVCRDHGGSFSSSSDSLSCSFAQPPELDHSQVRAAGAFCMHVLRGSFSAHLQELEDVILVQSYTCLLSR
jgi:hypothetical protein